MPSPSHGAMAATIMGDPEIEGNSSHVQKLLTSVQKPTGVCSCDKSQERCVLG